MSASVVTKTSATRRVPETGPAQQERHGQQCHDGGDQQQGQGQGQLMRCRRLGAYTAGVRVTGPMNVSVG
jgi:hypothetical protein